MGILCILVELYVVAIFARIILSWFPLSPDGAMAGVFSFLYTITEPLLGPLRRLLPPVGLGGMGLDLSPIIALLVIQLILGPILCSF